jgi:3-isopropylmalate/(R)-2-methylmalate dehydratase small subunit
MRSFTARYISLPVENIDTDQIIPARFLKTTEKTGLGVHAFHDWRYDAQGNPDPNFILNTPEAAGAEILVAGHNFGCGSSREHAPWALLGCGFRAIVSSGFADIFKNNALKNGLLPVQIEAEFLHHLLQQCGTLTIDLESQTLTIVDDANTASRSTHFPIDPFAKHCLLHGVDELGFLLNHQQQILAFEQTHDHTFQHTSL